MKNRRKDKLDKFLSEESNDLTPEQRKIIENTGRLIKSVGNEKLPAEEKADLWNRISENLLSEKQETARSVRPIWLRIAATIAILFAVGIGYYALRENTESAMERTAAAIVDSGAATQLILADKRKIQLTKKNSSLVYKETGEAIQIDSGAVVNQALSELESSYNTLLVPYGKRAFLTLQDGTEIWVNSGSKLVYPSRFTEKAREVYLEGQAYFSVRHRNEIPFYVHTKNIKVEVLGTEFDVSAYNDDSQTYAVLAKGSIELTTNKKSFLGSSKRKMVPGTRASYDPANKVLNVIEVDIEEYTSWKSGYLILKEAPLNDILKRLSRYYNVELLLGDKQLGSVKFKGHLDLRNTLPEIIDIIAASNSLNYHQTERRFILEKNTIKE